jgi:hypothetical protein
MTRAVDTGYRVREGAELIVARLLRDPANWPSQQEGSEALRLRIAWANRARVTRRQIDPFLTRYDVRVAA